MKRLIPLALLLTLGGCASFNEMLPDEDSSQYEPLQLDYSVPPSTGGGLFRSGYSGSLIGDKRAVRVGDILTVVLDESTQSSKSAGTSFGKSSGVSVGIPTVLGNTYDRLESSAEAERDFNGSARSSQQNTLRGSIAVTVHQVLPNGTLLIKGENAYGYAKTESGVHRLVRISPYDSSARRHTSFSSVWVYPVIDDTFEIEINPADLKIDTYRASGAGGQHVNTTDSAVRITHLPTGTVVTCQDGRSQHKNKEKAMQVLRTRLYDAQREATQGAEAEARKAMVGSGDRSERIRTYNFPQGRLTDHRINLTIYRLNEVMEGDLDQVLEPLKHEHQADLLAALADENR